MNNADFRHKCLFQTQSETRTEYGDREDVWEDAFTLGGSVKQLAYNKLTILNKQTPYKTIEITLRENSNSRMIDINYRVIVDEVVYYITNVDRITKDRKYIMVRGENHDK